jgi:hypothetical protein
MIIEAFDDFNKIFIGDEFYVTLYDLKNEKFIYNKLMDDWIRGYSID